MSLASPVRVARLARVLTLGALAALAAAPAAAQPADTAAAPAPRSLAERRPAGAAPAADTTPRRPRAVDVSSGYDRRLTIHRWGSYVMLPLFAAQYVLGDRLLEQKEDAYAARRIGVDDGLRNAHLATAIGVGALFTVNTVTGVWNLVESRGVADGRTRRTVHALSMLVADAGFVATGVVGRDAVNQGPGRARAHRNVAAASMGISALSAAAMLILNRD